MQGRVEWANPSQRLLLPPNITVRERLEARHKSRVYERLQLISDYRSERLKEGEKCALFTIHASSSFGSPPISKCSIRPPLAERTKSLKTPWVAIRTR